MLQIEPRALEKHTQASTQPPNDTRSHLVLQQGLTVLEAQAKHCSSYALSISIFIAGSEILAATGTDILGSICKQNTQVPRFHSVCLDLEIRLLDSRPLEGFWWGHICHLCVPLLLTSPVSRVVHFFGILSLPPRIRDGLTGAEA